MAADSSLHRVRIEIADHDHRGIAWRVDARIEPAQLLAGDGVQRFVGADRQALDEKRGGIEELELIHQVAQGVGVAHALFGQDHASFPLDRVGIEGQFAGRLAHQH